MRAFRRGRGVARQCRAVRVSGVGRGEEVDFRFVGAVSIRAQTVDGTGQGELRPAKALDKVAAADPPDSSMALSTG